MCRYRKLPVVDTVLEQLIKHVGSEDGSRVEDLPVRQSILNALIRVHPRLWLQPICLSILRLPEFGNIGQDVIDVVLDMLRIYDTTAKPKEFALAVARISDRKHEIRMIGWYFRVLSILGRIDFECLTLDQVLKTDDSMMYRRFITYPGDVLSESVYNVFFTVCCGKIKSLLGYNQYGHKDLAYSMHRCGYVCVKAQVRHTRSGFLEI